MTGHNSARRAKTRPCPVFSPSGQKGRAAKRAKFNLDRGLAAGKRPAVTLGHRLESYPVAPNEANVCPDRGRILAPGGASTRAQHAQQEYEAQDANGRRDARVDRCGLRRQTQAQTRFGQARFGLDSHCRHEATHLPRNAPLGGRSRDAMSQDGTSATRKAAQGGTQATRSWSRARGRVRMAEGRRAI